MPVLRKRAADKPSTNGLYVHSSPPKVLQLSSAHIKQLIRSGDIDKLEQIVLDGHGKKLLGEYSADYKTRTFLKSVPTLMSKISLLHDAVNSGRLEELKSILDEEPEKKKRLVTCKDDVGLGLLHKAVYYDLTDIYKYLIQQFPHIIAMKDSEGRTAYHYTPMCKDSGTIQKLLIAAGADSSILDYKQHSAKYYMNRPQELELPSSQNSTTSSRKSTATRESLNVKKSNIRIWIHQRNLSNLQQVVWEGHGSRLLVEHSNNPKIKKFLEAVPHIMGLIKEIHNDVLTDNLESLKNRVRPPIPAVVFSGKDANGLTPLHKAAGLGKQEMVEYIIAEYPNSVNIPDNEGRTPLHYAALLKDDGKMMNYLIEHGADESALDNKQKTAAYYKTRHSEIDSSVLNVVPDCPRSAKESFVSNFDWNMLTAVSPIGETAEKVVKKVENLFGKTMTKAEMKMDEVREKILENGIGDTENGNGKETVNENGNEEEEKSLSPTENPNNKEENGEENREENEENNNNEEEANEENINGNSRSNENIETINENQNHDECNGKNEEIEENEENGANTEAETNNIDPVDNDLKSRPNSVVKSRPGSKSSNKSRPASNKSYKEEEKPELEPEGVIEGIVNGENEVESLNNDGREDDGAQDEDIKAMVQSGNMEQLATLVLNGDGEKLVGQTSDHPELQAFLDNVPVYMAKINRIHNAARNGSLRELQAALDRRKFAIAKDSMSAKGASPLHVAVAFGNTSIVRYLAGRFPETLQAVDDDGRTPLHYAATLSDNGHYYNLLVHLGADSRALDKFNHTPDYYRSHKEDLSHRSLLKVFGAEELADEIINDKDKAVVENGQVDMPFFATEEGRYLASSLGDPLIKGLTEVANKRPEDPIAYLATYLYNFAKNRNPRSRARTQESLKQISGPPETSNESEAIPPSIEVVTVEPEDNDEDDSAFNSTSRDEHGQSMLHFAAARAHGRNALFQLLLETEINVAYRDELYRTARDISIQANIPENTEEIDRYVLHIATKGDTDKLVELLLDGYDHITDILDEDDVPINEAVAKHNQPDTVSFLQSILAFEEKRERVHHAIREGNLSIVHQLLADENNTGSGKLLAIGKNSYGRCSLHIAVLCQQEEIVDYLAHTFPDTVRLGDNLERTALHYAMGVDKMESISKVLIHAGAQRVAKDLKGRQPTYYFLNKSEILRLQEEEETF